MRKWHQVTIIIIVILVSFWLKSCEELGQRTATSQTTGIHSHVSPRGFILHLYNELTAMKTMKNDEGTENDEGESDEGE
jgi:hypothetical protein